jgi:hypothetical protein
MPTILSINEIIEIGRVSTYLSANYVGKGSLYGGTVIEPTPPIQIAMVTDALSWGDAGGAESSESLISTANYLYWLTGMFQLQSQNIISGPGGGSVVPTPSGGSLPNPYDFEVPATVTSDAPLADGDSTVTLDGTNGTRDYRGYNIVFNRNNVPQSVVNQGGSYYSWNRTTGQFTASPAAVLTEIFTLIPIG